MELVIQSTWDGDSITHEPVYFSVSPKDDGLHITMSAPFFNDPGNPGGLAGHPFDRLWEFEGASLFDYHGV